MYASNDCMNTRQVHSWKDQVMATGFRTSITAATDPVMIKSAHNKETLLVHGLQVWYGDEQQSGSSGDTQGNAWDCQE